MKFDGYKLVPLSKIVAPGDVSRRQSTEGVKQLVESIQRLGDEPMHALVARKHGGAWVLIAGRDRFSALLLLKAKRAWVHVVAEATPVELIEAEVHENLRRRDVDRDAMTADLVRRVEAVLPSKPNGNSKPGRPVTAHGEARAIVAEASGRTVEAVRQAEGRAKVREEGPGPVTRPTAPPPPIDLHGQAMPAHMIDVAGLVAAFDKLDKLLRQAQIAAGDLGMFANVPPGVVQRLKGALHNVAVEVRAAAPAHLCPKCNGQSHPTTGPFCPQCMERGWVTNVAFKAAPKKAGLVPPELDRAMRDERATAYPVPSVEEHAAGLDPAPATKRPRKEISVNGVPLSQLIDKDVA